MKKLFASLVCLCFLVSCEINEYPVESYEITNAVDGTYTVVYQEQTGFPDQGLDIEVKKEDKIILEYSSDYKTYYFPEKILYLFDYQDCAFYYIENRTVKSKNVNYKSEPYCYIAYDGDNEELSNLTMQNKIQINIAMYRESEYYQEELNSISDILQKNITEQEIVGRFTECGYNSEYILEIYEYSKSEL